MEAHKFSLIFILIFVNEPISTNADDGGTTGCGDLSIAEIPNKLTKVPWTANLHLQIDTNTEKTLPAVILSPTMILLNANYLFSDANDYKFRLFHQTHYIVRTNITKYAEGKSDNPSVLESKITHIRIHPNFNRKPWAEAENDVAIVHLQDPINFDSEVHSVCLAKATQANEILNIWNNSSSFVLVSGWKRKEEEGTVLRMTSIEEDQCKKWWDMTGNSHAKYSNRICANVSTENSHTSCINRDIGSFMKINGSFFFVGFVNNFYTEGPDCNSQARFFISYCTDTILQWINNNTKCGPHQFTCSNGDCIPLEKSICNKTSECSDGSDEDLEYCSGFNYCDSTQIPCGINGKCVAKGKRCNGEKDCENNEDEENCPTVYVKQTSSVVAVIVVAAVGVVIIFILSVLFWRKIRIEQGKRRNLTDEEVEEFVHGFPSTNPIHGQISERHYANIPGKPETNFAWDKHRFEIPRDKLKIIWSSVLGAGASGIVYSGFYDGDKGYSPVAVKTFKPTSDVQDLKMQLSELKIMTKVGSHDNIVNLIGAYTREIKQRFLFVVMELCPVGSLENYLKNNRKNFVDFFNLTSFVDLEDKQLAYENMNKLTTCDLIRWSYQIANGMEHLGSINITHGDLATRNILLTETFTAKISDFGLARNLYESGIYVKKNQVPLPWRWMALESLRDFEFSTRSDVWSYGVTIWEIFSLGCVPYPGLSWSQEFVHKLQKGLRMSQPPFSSIEIYDLMLGCWHQEPTKRPEFSTLKEYFHELLPSFKPSSAQTEFTAGSGSDSNLFKNQVTNPYYKNTALPSSTEM